ncbi:hypothetical protein [Rhodopirellula baltica]
MNRSNARGVGVTFRHWFTRSVGDTRRNGLFLRALKIARWDGGRLVWLSPIIGENIKPGDQGKSDVAELAGPVEPASNGRGWVGFQAGFRQDLSMEVGQYPKSS